MARKRKPYKARSLKGAQTFVRMLLKQREETNKLLAKFDAERLFMARMAADGPSFYDPMEAMVAKEIRDRLLIKNGYNLDGSRIV